MSDAQKPLIIKNWQKAMADSEHLGHALLLKADIESFPGAVKVKNKMAPMAILITQRTFTADAASDLCTASGDLRTQAEIDGGNSFLGAPVFLTSTGTLPAGLSANTVYFMGYVSSTTFKLSTTLANARNSVYINITDAGTGTHTVNPVPMGTIRHMVKDPRTGYLFGIDSNGRVWNTQSTNSYLAYLLYNSALDTGSAAISGATGNGLVTFRTSDGNHTYLFVFRSATIDVIDIFGDTQINSPSWSNSWKSLNSGAGTDNPHYALVAQDNVIYFVDDRYLGSITEVAGKVFAPGDSTTYVYNNQAITMPQVEINQWLEELNTNLLIAGGTYNKIYVWDRLALQYNYFMLCPEKKIYRLKNLGNVVYILAGLKGNIYSTQGTYVKFFKKVPFYTVNNAYALSASVITWGGIGAGNGTLLVGLAGSAGYKGVYKVYPDGRITIDQQSYSGNVLPTSLMADDDYYFIGYAGGMDSSDNLNQYSNFDTVLQSELYRTAEKTKKSTYSQVEVQLAKYLPSGNANCRISYRLDSVSNWTVLATFVLDTTSTSFNSDIGLIDIENIQVQTEIDGNTELLETRLFP